MAWMVPDGRARGIRGSTDPSNVEVAPPLRLRRERPNSNKELGASAAPIDVGIGLRLPLAVQTARGRTPPGDRRLRSQKVPKRRAGNPPGMGPDDETKHEDLHQRW